MIRLISLQLKFDLPTGTELSKKKFASKSHGMSRKLGKKWVGREGVALWKGFWGSDVASRGGRCQRSPIDLRLGYRNKLGLSFWLKNRPY